MPLAKNRLDSTQQTAALASFPNGSVNEGKLTLIFQIRDAKTKVVLKKYQFINMPGRIASTTEARVALYYTHGGPQIDIPTPTGVGVTYFSITGHTGFAGITMENNGSGPLGLVTPDAFVATIQNTFLHIGQPLPVRGSWVDGMAAVKDLQDVVRAYLAPIEQPQTAHRATAQDLQLEFINLTAPISAQDRTGRSGWIIAPYRNLVDISQDASKPFVYSYSFQFAAIAPFNQPVEDQFVDDYVNPQETLRDTLKRISAIVTSVKNGVNTIRDAFDQMVIGNFTGPVSTLLLSSAQLGDAVRGFADGIKQKVEFPLYAQRLISDALDAPAYSVITLGQAARRLGTVLAESSLALATSIPGAGIALTAGINDLLTLGLNGEDPVTLTLGTITGGSAIAATIQSQVQALTPQQPANMSAYRHFTATYDEQQGQYHLASGTGLSDAARVNVAVNPDSDLTPGDASGTLGLGLLNGGQERPGSSIPVDAIALLQGLDEACTHLLAFPDFFADQLAAQDAALAKLQPDTTTRPRIQGDQWLSPVRITPGDTIQAIAARAGVPWETLALVNGLTYPYILQEPSTVLAGSVSSADRYSITDITLNLVPNSLQGERLDIPSGDGAGQSRIILRNTTNTFVIDQAWSVLPTDISNYAIRHAANPIIQTSTVTSAGARTLTDTSLALIPDSQRGLTVMIASGQVANSRRRVVENSVNGYIFDVPWDVIPESGAIYLVLVPSRGTVLRQRFLGDVLSVPRPSSAGRSTAIRGNLEDVSTITGRALTREEKLFGRDWLLSNGNLVWDPVAQDCVTVAGLENLRQAVINLVNLPLGQLEYDPGLGSYLHDTLGHTASLPSQIELLQSVERTLTQDKRIARLAGADVFTSGGKTFLSLAAAAITGDVTERVVIR